MAGNAFYSRIDAKELTLKRLFSAVGRRMNEFPHAVAWRMPTVLARENRLRLKKYHDIHAGQRCFIMGNGPSLAKMDFGLLKFERDASSLAFLKMKFGFADTFATDILRPLSSGGTVTYVALQIAFFMGFRDVILVGLDHSFVEEGTPNRVEIRKTDRDESHFHPEYFPKGSKWQLPDLKRSELAYALARQAFERSGRRILDATPGGKCPVFEKVEFGTLF